jgi:putative ABC transport system permease protein
MKVLNLTLGKTYILTNKSFFTEKKDVKEFKLKIVGIFTYKSLDDPYWYNGLQAYNTSIFMDMNLLQQSILTDQKIELSSAQWFFAYDYHKIKVEDLPTLVDTFKSHDQWFSKYSSLLVASRAADAIIKEYKTRVAQLNITLFVLQVPILVILAFYSFMISKLKIDFESNEIAVIKSRGGSSLLIFATYLIESFIIGIISLIIGPILGLYLCTILGAANGFLEFVQRLALPLSLTMSTYMYALAAVLFITLSMLIPAFIASRTSIVLYKQKNARHRKTTFWKKYCLDLVLLAISFYGLYSYQRQQKILFVSGMNGADMVIDPLLFIVSVLFVFGCGLLALRIFPFIIKFIFWLGRKIWNPVFYASFIQVGRTTGQEQFTMLFIILTLSIGIFSANSARTINKNMEEKARYEIGADVVIEGHWTNNQPPPTTASGPPVATIQKKEAMYYFEPPFAPFKKLTSAASVTKVFKYNKANIFFNDEYIENTPLMGIIPNEFGKTAWFRNDLLPYHWYQYLNLLTDSPSAVLASKAFKDKNGAREGDSISIGWGDGRSISGIIYAFLDYWPSINPNKKTNDVVNPYFVVANLQYMQDMNLVEPYQVWIKKKPGTTINEFNREIINKKIEIESIEDTAQKIITYKNDPMLQGTNGSLTLSFTVTILITILGFLIYWILSIKKRILQFGIFRAIGLTSKEIIGMIACEQLLITGSSILAGIELGNLTSKIFVPLFQMVYGSEGQVPPFKVVSDANDYIRLYVILALMLILCFYIIGRLLSKINISQALKLGED